MFDLAFLILVVGCLAVGFVLFKAARARAAIYRYDVRADQHYDFSGANAQAVAGRLSQGSLTLDAAAAPGDLVFLELRIRSTLLGRWFEPGIEIATTRQRCRQPVERGAAGRRYVELTRLALEGETALRLSGHHLRIPDQTVVLHRLRQSLELDRKKILVLGTHPDDAEIAAFGVYADRDAYVVTLTAGEAGEPGAFARFGRAAAFTEKGRNRAWNSLVVPMLGGLSIERTANLGYFDGTLQAMREQPDTPVRSLHADAALLEVFGFAQDENLIGSRALREATWTNLVADLEHLLKVLQPDIVVAPYPRLDLHPDHKMSTVALLQALQNLNCRDGSLLLYANHLSSSDRYPFGRAGDPVSLPPGIDDIFFDGIVSHPLDPAQQARKHMALDAMIDLRPVVDIDSLRSVAMAFVSAVKCALTDGHVSYFRQAVRANELFFEVRMSSLHRPGVTERILG